MPATHRTFILARTPPSIVLLPPYILPTCNAPTVLDAHSMSLSLLLRVLGFLVSSAQFPCQFLLSPY